MVRIPILGLPVGPDEASSLLEVGRLVKVFLASLNFCLHASTRLGPLTQMVLGFFVATLVSELLVLVLPPDLLQALLFQVSCREVRIEVGASFELVRRRVLDLLLVVGVERLERRFESGAFCLPESAICVRESDRARGACC